MSDTKPTLDSSLSAPCATVVGNRQRSSGKCRLIREVTNIVTSLDSLRRRAGASRISNDRGDTPRGSPGTAARGRGLLKSKRRGRFDFRYY